MHRSVTGSPAMADQEQPDWLDLPSDLLELIGQRTRDAVTGVAAFRSVCRTWRAAIGPAPRLLLPRAGAGHALVFPLSRGWSIVVDARDVSCRLSHLAAGVTAALPRLNMQRTVRELALGNDLRFTDLFRFAVHAPPDAPAAAAGMTVMMYHMQLGRTGVLFCRPGDAAWTEVEKPTPIGLGFSDFAYHDGKMFGLDTNGEMAVYDAATLDVLHLVRKPPDTPILGNTMTSVKFFRPVAFSIFELGSTPDGLAWLKVPSTIAAYCYSMQDNRLECVYSSPEDSLECSTKPSWFVP
ncbi:hypothetical protein GQ55_7G198900 [Panicum hallii var. hallii]|uniref:KIB1-4 beta-propeller domain-containing protein n=1 Tax=Panicum hallii var. hallii TaxID=1504633 RepID=A0A2T7CWX5_9POAL|nr:hypothetical protein GQ55_7G198900 [Panicum hallii var. hallii]